MSLWRADRTSAAATAQMDTTDSSTPRISEGHTRQQLNNWNVASWCSGSLLWRPSPLWNPSLLTRHHSRWVLLTCSMPPEGHDACGRPGGQPQGEKADGDAAKVSQKMRRIRHDGQTVSGVSTCRRGENEKPEGRLFFSLSVNGWSVTAFFFVPTNHLSSHEEEAHGTGHAQLPPGPMPRVAVRPRRGVGLLAEPLPPPQLVLIRGTLAPFWSRIATGLKRWTVPGRQNSWFSNQKTKTHMKELQTYHPRGLGWEWISCCFSENSMSSVDPPQGLTLV